MVFRVLKSIIYFLVRFLVEDAWDLFPDCGDKALTHVINILLGDYLFQETVKWDLREKDIKVYGGGGF